VARAGVLVTYTVDGRLVGVVAVNAQQAFTAMTRALMANVPPMGQPAVPEPSMSTTGDRRANRRLRIVA
jgi:hypothetical protein